tara:strand:- start:4359 stop:4496 length:138 start_codon:yes stop_codon:yes gene_type:complete
MRIQELFTRLSERSLHGSNLLDDVNAVSVRFNHPDQSTSLPLDPT